MQEGLNNIVKDLEFLSGWEERYTYIIELGRSMILSADEQIPENRVDGCVSQVWLVYSNTPDGTIKFNATSDSLIVKGLLAIIISMFSNQKPEKILAIDPYEGFKRLDLENHLSPSRSNGFFAIIKKIKTIAVQLLQNH